jgi:hypothetical protein
LKVRDRHRIVVPLLWLAFPAIYFVGVYSAHGRLSKCYQTRSLVSILPIA